MTANQDFRKLEQEIREKLDSIKATLHEQYADLEREVLNKLNSEYILDLKLSLQGVEFKESPNGKIWFHRKLSWSQLDKPDLYALALDKMRLVYKVTEKPLSYLELSDRVELTYPNHRVLFTMEFLLDRNVKFR